jgi:alanyl-tRNA synthetase
MMTSQQIRQSFLDFFKSKQHTIVSSSSLMPDSPNLLFTNAGMNQFVPIFLGQTKCPYTPGRAADTQKCIRAGGKHNDLDDVGLDTYHHTFFEMLGNWSFGDYFKKEAIEWAWELVVDIWKFPPQRLYATVFCPHMNTTRWTDELANVVNLARQSLDGAQASLEGVSEPGAAALEWSDKEAAFHWAKHFLKAGLDPLVHIIPGNKKDNFWMMGETGPCGPCSELHVDLTPAGDTKGSLVNKGDAGCIEIWNLVFIQFNANPDGTFSPLPARHVDTGMGFERVTSIIQGTKDLTDFAHAKISNYETDIFRPIFDAIEKLSGRKYGHTLPPADLSTINPQQSTDVAFRVIADHIRTLSFAIADGIQPGNNDRNYVLRRILRRAVRYGRTLGFHEPFFYRLVDVLADTMGDVFPEIRAKKKHVQEVIQHEEEAFNKTLDKGIEQFEEAVRGIGGIGPVASVPGMRPLGPPRAGKVEVFPDGTRIETRFGSGNEIKGEFAFKLYDTYGFPLDLTELMARERGFGVDKEGFEELMEEQRARARAAQKKQVIEVKRSLPPTKFVGYDKLEVECLITDFETIVRKGGGEDEYVVVNVSPLYAEMGGQVGDTGSLERLGSYSKGFTARVVDAIKKGDSFLLKLDPAQLDDLRRVEFFAHQVPKDPAILRVDKPRREAIQRHHTVTHLFHWALHEVVSKDATQKGSFVGPDKLTFDFNSAPLTTSQIADIEKLVNERILENAGVSWTEVPYAEVKSRKDILQFFGDKYGDTVRVVQIGGKPQALDGYSMELCGGTHTRATGEIGLFRIVGESAIAAGVRRIEAVAGLQAYDLANQQLRLLRSVAGYVNSPIQELEKKIESLLAHQKELEKQVKIAMQRNASNAASELLGRAQTVNGIPLITHNLGDADGDFLQAIADALKGRFKGVVVLGGVANDAVTLVATVSSDFTAKVQAGKIIQQIAPIVGGNGGGKRDNARGGGKDARRLEEALAKAADLMK